jgi:outer membrane immunogenic protein
MMRLFGILIAATCAAASTQSALAADLPVKAKPIDAGGYSWTGFYAGVNVGYGVGRDPSRLTNITNPAPGTLQINDAWHLDPEGAVGGIQAGYNYQMGRWVFGMETDIQATAQKDFVCRFCSPASAFNAEQKLPWFGTVRGRIGWAAGPIYSYFTGGLAYGQVETNVAIPIMGSPTVGAATHETKAGWIYGSGIEAALAGNWTVKFEYLYMSLGSTVVPFFTSGSGASRTMFTSDIRDRIVRAGVNYRFGPTTGTGSATFPAPTFANWTGFYAGGNGGYGVGRNSSALTVNAPAAAAVFIDQWKESPGGYFGGAQFGYGWQTGKIVFGIETDIQGSGMKDSACVAICGAGSINDVVEQRIKWFGTTRGRVGYAAGPALFYATGGLAYGNVKTTLIESSPLIQLSATASTSSTKTGWTVGAGAEAPIWGNWTAKTEYLYMDLGSTSLSMTSISPLVGPVFHTLNSDIKAHIFRGGANYHF